MTSSGLAAEIKSKLPVIDVVGETVALKRAGSAYKGLCPFHSEKTPSFVVSPDRETWHCFGCGEGGDIFTFLMRRDGVDFRDALARLAERAGVELSERTAKEDRRKRRLREALEAAVAWYREVFLQAHQAQRARDYLAERGLSVETLERFAIGYAPNTWDAMTRRLIGRGFTNEELIGAGLASPSNRGGVVDKFRGRIIIPIRDASGRAVGLGGRIMPGADGPKYLNSPAGPLFDKSRTLFGIDLAKNAIRREKLAVIVEGYTDVMAAHQAGFANVVASLGTALTAGQVELATRYADAVALAYDVDLAGEVATQRGLLEELGPDQSVSKVRVVRIPAGKDPDELIRTDPGAWRTAVANAKPAIEYFIERTANEVGLDSVAGKRDVTGRVLAVLKRVGDPIERNLYVQRLAQLVGVEERILHEALQRQPVRRGAHGLGLKERQAAPQAEARAQLGPLEREALMLLMRYPGLARELPHDRSLPVRDATAAALADAWRAHVAASNGNAVGAAALERFVASLDPATGELARDLLARVAASEFEASLDSETAARVLREALLRLRIQRLEEDLRDGRLLLEEAQRDGDRARLDAIEQRLIQLGHEKAEATREMHEPADVAGARRS
ncbi:MAG TPA: DNA primase [Candidatus Limnocylindria bacterium]|nr:DNA primase [Candidatus Limnocylindria bacterium]